MPSLDSADPQQLWQWWRQKGITESALKSAIQSGKTEAELGVFFEAHKAFLEHEKREILQANEQFFLAQSAGDLAAMQALWVRSERTVCSTNVYVQVCD
jgi:iron uptake system EfeUOB component EfeO/EfeM